MKQRLRILLVALTAALALGALASGALLAQGELRITPLDSPIALFCGGTNNKTLSAYRFDKDGTTHFAWSLDVSNPTIPAPVVTAEATAEAPAPAPAPTNVLIDQEGIGLHLETDGRLSVSTTQWDGKQFVLFFHGCPDPGSLDAFVIDNGTWIPFRLN